MLLQGRWKWYTLLSVLAAVAMAGGALVIIEARGAPPAETAGQPAAQEEPHVKVDLAIRASTGDKISDKTENDKRDVDISASGTENLGEQPMGSGRQDAGNKDNSYVCTSEVVGTVTSPDNPGNLQFQIKREYSERSWYVKKDGENWNATNRNVEGVQTPTRDSGSLYNDTTPSATKNVYSYDNAGVRLSDDASKTSVGDYVMDETKFTYTVQVKQNGKWVTAGTLDVYQTITAKRIANTGKVCDDWQGVQNSYSTNATDLKINADKVKDVTGAATDKIKIDPNANKNK